MDTAAREAELRTLMVAGLAGDAEAHRALLTTVSGYLRAYFKRRLTPLGRDASEAEDLVQETLMAVHTRRHTYDAALPFTPWMYGIARYKLIDFLRRTRSSTRDVPLEDARELAAHSDLTSVDSSIDVEALLSQLSPRVRDAVRAVKLDGLTIAEAAARSGRSPSAIKVSVHRGLRTLARLFTKDRL